MENRQVELIPNGQKVALTSSVFNTTANGSQQSNEVKDDVVSASFFFK